MAQDIFPPQDGDAVTISGISAGGGGPGLLHLRYGNVYGGTKSMRVSVGGVDQGIWEVENMNGLNAPGYSPTEWRTATFAVTFQPGNNTVHIEHENGNNRLDELTISTPSDLNQASPHRRVSLLSGIWIRPLSQPI